MLEPALQDRLIQQEIGERVCNANTGCQKPRSSPCAWAQYMGIYRYSRGCLSLSKTFRPSSTWFIPRIFPRGEVTDSHYGILYYRHDPIHACPSFVGRTVHGPLSVVREWEVLWFSAGPSSCLVGAKGVEQASVWSAPLVCPAGLADAVFVCATRGGSR
jgi:hypothetical protein